MGKKNPKPMWSFPSNPVRDRRSLSVQPHHPVKSRKTTPDDGDIGEWSQNL